MPVSALHARLDDDHRRAAVHHGADREFGLPRHADLAHQQQVERRVQRARHLQPDRHAATRQREHDRIGQLHPRQPLAERATGDRAVLER